MDELIAFDLDGTLVASGGGWRFLHEQFDTRPDHERLLEAYRSGEYTWPEYCAATVELWRERGLTRSDVDGAIERVRPVEGARDVLAHLEEVGCAYGIISSGVGNLAEPFAEFDLDFVVSNEILFEGNELAGVDALDGVYGKDELLRNVCTARGIDPADATFVGDGPTDAAAFDVAGTSVLVGSEPDEALVRRTDVRVEAGDLRDLLPHLPEAGRPVH